MENLDSRSSGVPGWKGIPHQKPQSWLSCQDVMLQRSSPQQVCTVWWLALSLFLLPLPARATSVLEYSFSALVQTAEVIAVGTVTPIQTTWDARHNLPHTRVTFADLEVLKGAVAQPELTLQFLGGPTPDGGHMEIAGMPQFTEGERNVIFYAGNHRRAVPLVGIWQGVYRVVRDPAQGVDIIHDHAGRPVTALPTTGGRLLHDDITHAAPRATAPTALPLHTHDDPAQAVSPTALTLHTLRQRIAHEVRRRR